MFQGIDPAALAQFANELRSAADRLDDGLAHARSGLALADLHGHAHVLSRLSVRADTLRIVAVELDDRAELVRTYAISNQPVPRSVENAAFAGLASFTTIDERQDQINSWSGTDNDPMLDDLVRAQNKALNDLRAGRNGDGDIDETFATVAVTPFTRSAANDPTERGRAALISALNDTATPSEIQRDEFKVIDHGNGSFTIVLAGVIDLSSPHLGLDPVSRSARDVDVHAAPSAPTTDVDDNVYAQMVRQWTMANIPPGSNVMIVGHSFGADTALDLAADPLFNGPDGVNVTHVHAAGYNSVPQLPHVPDTVRVLVTQNNADAAVHAERALHHPGGAVEGVKDWAGGWSDTAHGAGRAAAGAAEMFTFDDPIHTAGTVASGANDIYNGEILDGAGTIVGGIADQAVPDGLVSGAVDVGHGTVDAVKGLGGVLSGGWNTFEHAIGTRDAITEQLHDTVAAPLRAATTDEEWEDGNRVQYVAEVAGLESSTTGIRHHSTKPQTVSVFAGDNGRWTETVGHHQDHYTAHLDELHDSTVDGFLADVDLLGYTNNGTAVAVDISVPR